MSRGLTNAMETVALAQEVKPLFLVEALFDSNAPIVTSISGTACDLRTTAKPALALAIFIYFHHPGDCRAQSQRYHFPAV